MGPYMGAFWGSYEGLWGSYKGLGRSLNVVVPELIVHYGAAVQKVRACTPIHICSREL